MRFLRTLLFIFCIFIILGGIAAVFLSGKYVVPIFMYHNVDYSDEVRSDTVSPERFRIQMDYIKNNGYQVIRLHELVDGIRQGRSFPHKTVAITFDDGYQNNYEYAFPILAEYQFPATFFISPDFIGKEGFLDWQQLNEMKEKGIEFGSHGMTQAYLPGLPIVEQKSEIFDSKSILQKKLNSPIRYFSYPVGGFTEEVKDFVKKAGYQGALTTNRGYDRYNKDVYELNRIRLSDKDNIDFYVWSKLTGYYNRIRTLKKPY